MNGEAGKREKLIRAAMELFAEDGYDKVSIRQIAAAAGVNSSMISYYFNGKSGLYEAIVKELLQNFDSFIGSVRAEEVEPREGLRLYVQTISRLYAKYPPSFVKLVYRELLNPSEIFEQVAVGRFRQNFGVLLNLIERGKAQGLFRTDLDSGKMLMMFISSISLYFLARPIYKKIIEQDDTFTQAYLEQAVEVFMRGIEVAHDE